MLLFFYFFWCRPASAIQFIFEQTAINSTGIKFNSAFGFQSYFFGEFEIAGKNITKISAAFLFHKITDTAIGFLQFFNISQPFTILRVHIKNTGNIRRYFSSCKITNGKINQVSNPCCDSILLCIFNGPSL